MNRHIAPPDFAMSFTSEAVRLEQRDGHDWRPLGEARFAGRELTERLAALREQAGTRPGPLDTVLVIPDDQILYTTLTVPVGSDTPAAVARALEAMTPYAAADLAFDWCPAQNGDIETLRVAAVARRTLEEAEDFARAQGFRPQGFIARPDDGRFEGQPDFGPSRLATQGFARPPFSEPDLTQARVTDPAVRDPLPQGDGTQGEEDGAAAASVPGPVSRIVPHVVPARAEPALNRPPAASDTPEAAAAATPGVIRHGDIAAGEARTLAAPRVLSPRAQGVHDRAHQARASRPAPEDGAAPAASSRLGGLQRLDPGRLPVMMGLLVLGLALVWLFWGQPSATPGPQPEIAATGPEAAPSGTIPAEGSGVTGPSPAAPAPRTVAAPAAGPAEPETPLAAAAPVGPTAALPEPAVPARAPERTPAEQAPALAANVTETPSAAASTAEAPDVAPADPGAPAPSSVASPLPDAARPPAARPPVAEAPAPSRPPAVVPAPAPAATAPVAALPSASGAPEDPQPAGDALSQALAQAMTPGPASVPPPAAPQAPASGSALGAAGVAGPAAAAFPPAAGRPEPAAGAAPITPPTVPQAARPAATAAPSPSAAPRLASSARPPRVAPVRAAPPAAADTRPAVPAQPQPAAERTVPAAVTPARPPARPAATPTPAAAPDAGTDTGTGTGTAAPPAAERAVSPAPGVPRPPLRPQRQGFLEEGSRSEDGAATRLTEAERRALTDLLRDLRTAQAGHPPLGRAEREAVFRLAEARPTRKPVAVGGPSQQAVQAAVAAAVADPSQTAPRSTALRASSARLDQSARPSARPGGAQRTVRGDPGPEPGPAPGPGNASLSGAAIDQAIAAAVSESTSRPGAVALTALRSSALPPRRAPGATASAAATAAAAIGAAVAAAPLAPTAEDLRAAAQAQNEAAALAEQRRQDADLQAQAEARARARAAQDAQAEAQARAQAEARARAQAEAEARTAAARQQRYAPPEAEDEPEVAAAVPDGRTPTTAGNAATVKDGIRINRTQIIGTIGAGKASRALVRLSNGRVLTLRLGDRINGGTITDIGDSRITFVKGGQAQALSVLGGQ